MGIHSILTHRRLQILLASLSLYASHSHGSPLTDNKNVCPRGWYQYERFCVTRGQGSSERAVALYCDGFGGIGIKGLCIISHTNDPTSYLVKEDNAVNLSKVFPLSVPNIQQPGSERDQMYATLSDRNNQVSPYRNPEFKEDSSSDSFLDSDILDNDDTPEIGFCPQGWTHYRNMCVYKPWSVTERCHQMNSIEFHGLCLKHADTHAETNTDPEAVYSKQKRICCCASFKAKGNNYGC
uniref:Uncharacterized protein n=1 Tax=Arion vulgaris TaxID=1028688 RepID=A0A0B7APQ7_9EUPU